MDEYFKTLENFKQLYRRLEGKTLHFWSTIHLQCFADLCKWCDNNVIIFEHGDKFKFSELASENSSQDEANLIRLMYDYSLMISTDLFTLVSSWTRANLILSDEKEEVIWEMH